MILHSEPNLHPPPPPVKPIPSGLHTPFLLASAGRRRYNGRVKWTPLRIYALKLALFSAALAYVALDLMLLRGPLYRMLHHPDAAAADTVLSVYGAPVSQAQFARYVAEQNLLAGRKECPPQLRMSMALGMAREALLRLRARYNDSKLPDLRAQAEEEVGALSTRCPDEQSFVAQLASQGYTVRRFTDKIDARLREQALLERAIAPHGEPDNASIAAHYRQLREELRIPATRPLRHIFFSTVERDADEARAAAELALKRLQAGEEFSRLAAELSDDERSRKEGGQLGTFRDDGRCPLGELPLFGEGAIAAGEPTLVSSRWGWHVLLAGPITPSYIPALDECRETLRTAIISAQRELGVNAYFNAALREGIHQKHIRFHVK